MQAWDGMGAWRVGFGDVSKEVEADALEMLLLLPRDRHSLRRTSAYEAAREPPRFDPDAFPAGDNVCRLSDIEMMSLLKAAGVGLTGRGAPKKRAQYIKSLRQLIRSNLAAEDMDVVAPTGT